MNPASAAPRVGWAGSGPPASDDGQTPMTLLFVVAHGASGACLRGLSAACRRNAVAFSVFFTGDGVRTLSAAGTVEHARHAAEAVVCEHSWRQVMKGRTCPLALGSQTDHSRMLGYADRVVSL